MKYICKCGNETTINWSDFNRSCRCIKCSGL